MSNLIVKPVSFNGDNLVAVKDEFTGKIYTGVSYICKGIGLTKDQKDRQVKNVQMDLVLKKGCVKFDAGVLDPHNEVIGIELDFLPLWLAKITITPKMQEEQPNITEKLVQYQLKAKDVLAEAFLNKPKCIEDILIQSLQEMKDVKYQIAAVKQESKEVKEEVQAIKDIIVINPKEEWRKQTNNILNQIGFKTKEYKKVKDEAYKALEDRAKCKLKIRLENLQGRALREGMAPSKVSQLNNLDVIANDVRLKEIYINIVKEMAIKNGVKVQEVV